jgi:peptide/nickel transport system permease protein
MSLKPVQKSNSSSALVRESESASRQALRRFARNRLALAGLVLIVLLTLMAVFAPWLAPYDPIGQNYEALSQAPSKLHLFGTDNLGRDVLSRTIYGARVSLSAGVIAVGLATLAGLVFGMMAGFFGGVLDEIIMRVVDAMLAFPFLVLAITLAAVLGPNLQNAMLAIAVVSAPVFARLARGQVLSERERDYVQAAHALGSSEWRIVTHHLLPNIAGPIIIQASLSVAGAILAESSLSFLGLGVQPPTPSWGEMLNTARGYLRDAPWTAVAPGSLIFISVLAFNLLGDGLRDALDPKGNR